MLCKWAVDITVKIDPDRMFCHLSNGTLYEQFG